MLQVPARYVGRHTRPSPAPLRARSGEVNELGRGTHAILRGGDGVLDALRERGLSRILSTDPLRGEFFVKQFVAAGAGPSGVAVEPDPPVNTPRPPTLIDAVNDSAASPRKASIFR